MTVSFGFGFGEAAAVVLLTAAWVLMVSMWEGAMNVSGWQIFVGVMLSIILIILVFAAFEGWPLFT